MKPISRLTETPLRRVDPNQHAIQILRENERGDYTLPTKGLYPYQSKGAGGANFTWTATIWLAWASPMTD